MGMGIRGTYAGGEGSVKVPRRSPKGLRNKRKAHWAKVRAAERAEKDRRERQRERMEQYDFASHYDF